MSIYSLTYRNAKRNVRHESPVHNINVKPVRLTLIDHFYIPLKIGKVSRQYRWGNKGCCHSYKYTLIILLKELHALQLIDVDGLSGYVHNHINILLIVGFYAYMKTVANTGIQFNISVLFLK